MKRTFIYTDDKSGKFWAIETVGTTFTVTFGKLGTDGQKSEKSFATDDKCQKVADKLIAEKTKKGYVEQSGADASAVVSGKSWLKEWESIVNADDRKAALVHHFATWAATDECKQIIIDLMKHVKDVTIDDDNTLTLHFESTDGEDYDFELGAPTNKNMPKDCLPSWKTAADLHGSVNYESGGGGNFYWDAQKGKVEFEFGYEDYDFVPDDGGKFKSNKQRFPVLAYAAQNFFMFDKAETNKIGEPLMFLFDHGGDFEDRYTFAGDRQSEIPFGIPGLILRVMGHEVIEDDPRFDDCGLG
ncbi:MAG: WGR domain-containing protein [Tannerella sp.]|nr:WGR domain-containing protein [Tannerella sp.]